MADKIFPKGIIAFAPNSNAPDWVLGDVVINLDEFAQWVKDNPDLLTNYKNQRQLKLSLTKGKENRPSLSVNTYKPVNKVEAVHAEAKKEYKQTKLQAPPSTTDGLPF